MLDYCSVVWNLCTKKYRQLLENVKRRATKLVSELMVLSYLKMIANVGDTEVKNVGLMFNDNNNRGHIFKLQKPMCN